MEKKELNSKVGKRVRELREYQHLTREQLAERAKISAQFLADIEYGNKSMTALTIINLAAALEVSADFLLTGKTDFADKDAQTVATMLAALPPRQKRAAKKMLQIFVDTLNSDA